MHIGAQARSLPLSFSPSHSIRTCVLTRNICTSTSALPSIQNPYELAVHLSPSGQEVEPFRTMLDLCQEGPAL